VERQGNEVHIDADEARAGSTPHTVRWILAAGLLLVIVFFAIIVMVGSATQSENEEHQTLRVQAQDQQTGDTDTDGIVSDRFDSLPNAPQEGGQIPPGRSGN